MVDVAPGAQLLLGFVASAGFATLLIAFLVTRSNGRRRVGFRFRLKALFTAVSLLAIVAHYGGMRLRAMSVIRSVGGTWDEDKVYLSESKVQDKDLRYLAWMGKIAVVQLARTNIGDDGVAQLRRIRGLRVVVLRGSRLGDAGLAELGRLRTLEFLDVRDTAVTGRGIQQFTTASPNCQVAE
ncbi:MAG: hypothetical protein ACREHD_30075 [Pirellulales bacterium]